MSSNRTEILLPPQKSAPVRGDDSNVAISVRDLAKCYTIVHEEKTDTLSTELLQRLRNPMKKRGETESFWALNGVSFDVRPGEVVGIIGRNGAGKSTLLKLLSRITEPTRGEAVLHGRVGSLLEVGTGFHPELTGRENVYLNGAVLGMTRAEIDREFDAIVEFSGTEKFLDTPVKRYSSGMYVRLAFAVAAHLEPEILIVDEVLAVGDSEFQKKCLGKMKDVAHQGRTVLFVSHAMNSVLQLCTRCIYMKQGRVSLDGDPQTVIDAYINEGITNLYEKTWNLEEAPGDDIARITAVRTRNPEGEITGDFTLSTSITIEMEYTVLQSGFEIMPVFHLHNMQNVCLFTNANAENIPWVEKIYDSGVYRVQITLPANLLNDGGYMVTPIITRGYNVIIAMVENAIQFEMHDDGSGRAGYTGPLGGVLRPRMPWHFEQLAGGEGIL